jgi:hypothetical protein|eukprot:SAG25_NODE_759_length_5531_cov_2.460052_4_plen_60_part_00
MTGGCRSCQRRRALPTPPTTAVFTPPRAWESGVTSRQGGGSTAEVPSVSELEQFASLCG